jgi:outer membrane protein
MLVAGFVPSANAQFKIGFILVEQIQEQAQPFLDAKDRLQRQVADKESEAQQLQEEMNRIAANLSRQEAILSEERKTQLQREIMQRRQDYERFATQAQEDLSRRQMDIMGPIQEQVRVIIKRLAEEEGYDLILDAAAILYLKDPDTDNLTDRVIEILNEEATQTTTPARAGPGPSPGGRGRN